MMVVMMMMVVLWSNGNASPGRHNILSVCMMLQMCFLFKMLFIALLVDDIFRVVAADNDDDADDADGDIEGRLIMLM